MDEQPGVKIDELRREIRAILRDIEDMKWRCQAMLDQLELAELNRRIEKIEESFAQSRRGA